MATRHHTTMEAGGWVLLAAVIAWLLYLLFSKDDSYSTSVTAVSSKIGGVSTGPPDIRPTNPDIPTVYSDANGTAWEWDPSGKQWFVSSLQVASSPIPDRLPNWNPDRLPLRTTVN